MRERELATFDENRRALGMLNPIAMKIEGTYRGGKGTTPVTTACPVSWKVKVSLKKKKKQVRSGRERNHQDKSGDTKTSTLLTI